MSEPLYDATAQHKIIAWRALCFERLGFSPFQAAQLAARRDVDRVEVERLLSAGASHQAVTEILL